MSFEKSMKCSNRSTRAKVKGHGVPDSRCSKSERTFTKFRLNEQES